MDGACVLRADLANFLPDELRNRLGVAWPGRCVRALGRALRCVALFYVALIACLLSRELAQLCLIGSVRTALLSVG